MKADIVPIGNSKGIRIPKVILEQCRIDNEVFLEVENNNILIKPVKKKPRDGWARAFKIMSQNKEDKLIIDDSIDFDIRNWKW